MNYLTGLINVIVFFVAGSSLFSSDTSEHEAINTCIMLLLIILVNLNVSVCKEISK